MKRRDMTEYQKAMDWQNRLSPRWWRAVFIALGVAVLLLIISGILQWQSFAA